MKSTQNPVVAATEISLNTTVERYLVAYQGADESRYHRITAWLRLLDPFKPLVAITPDDIDAGMAKLTGESARVYGGKDADGNPIFRKKTGQRSGATLNRYLVALAALFAWARRTLGAARLRCANQVRREEQGGARPGALPGQCRARAPARRLP